MTRGIRSGLAAAMLGCLMSGLQAQGLKVSETPDQQPQQATNAWTNAEWQALLDSARHRAGFYSYEFKWVFAADRNLAMSYRLRDWSRFQTVVAENLLDVPEALHIPLMNLNRPNETSDPFPYVRNGVSGWAVVRLLRRADAERLRPGPAFETAARRWVRLGALAAPAALLADPAERARVAYWNARTAQDIAAIDPAWTPNISYGDYFTPVTLAILRRDRPLAQALLARGATLSACSPAGCPLGIAGMTSKADAALEWTEWLLAKGAPVDAVDPRFQLADTTALGFGMLYGHLPVLEALFAAGASPDGAPGVKTTPIEMAAESGQRQQVEWLLRRGAQALPLDDRGDRRTLSKGNLYTAAKRSGNAEFTAWAANTMIQAAQTSDRFRFGAFVEQGQRRIELKDGVVVSLQAAPFQLVMHLPPSQAPTVQFGASFAAEWMEEVRRKDRRNPMFNQFTSAALAQVPSPDSYELFVGHPCPKDIKANQDCPGANWHLNRDDSHRKDFHQVRPAAHEYVREVRAIYDLSGGDKTAAKPLTEFAGQTLHLVMGVTLDLDGAENRMEIINPRYVRIRFEK